MKDSFMSCFLLILSFFLLSEITDARKDVEGYWKSMMNDQPMPQAIKYLLSHQDEDVPSLSAAPTKGNRFVRDFDVKPNAIIYHSAHHHHHADHEPAEMKPDIEPKPRIIQTVNRV